MPNSLPDRRAAPGAGTGVGTGVGTGASAGSTNYGPHGSNVANKLDPRVDSDRGL